MSKGLFITLEGIDGVGKTTLLRNLTDKLTESKVPYVLTKEPGDENYGSILGTGIRKLLFEHPTTMAMSPGVRDLLFLADHLQNVGTIIEPNLAKGKVVLCDRYSDSQYAYQGLLGDVPESISNVYIHNPGPIPDITILLTCEPKVALARAKNREFEISKQNGKKWSDAQKLGAIQEGYLYLLDTLKRTIKVDTTTASQFEVLDFVWKRIKGKIDAQEETNRDSVLNTY